MKNDSSSRNQILVLILTGSCGCTDSYSEHILVWTNK